MASLKHYTCIGYLTNDLRETLSNLDNVRLSSHKMVINGHNVTATNTSHLMPLLPTDIEIKLYTYNEHLYYVTEYKGKLFNITLSQKGKNFFITFYSFATEYEYHQIGYALNDANKRELDERKNFKTRPTLKKVEAELEREYQLRTIVENYVSNKSSKYQKIKDVLLKGDFNCFGRQFERVVTTPFMVLKVELILEVDSDYFHLSNLKGIELRGETYEERASNLVKFLNELEKIK